MYFSLHMTGFCMLKQLGNYFQQEKDVPTRSICNMVSIYIREYESDLHSNEH